MEHPAPLGRQYPWRTTALVAAALAAFELILLVIIVLALLAKPLLGDGSSSLRPAPVEKPEEAVLGSGKRAASAETKKEAAPEAALRLSRGETLVVVLNGNGTTGAASEKADLVRTKGYMIAGTANAPRTDFPRSVVMFRPGHRPEAERLARDFGVARVAPLDGLTPDDLMGAHVALIVGEE